MKSIALRGAQDGETRRLQDTPDMMTEATSTDNGGLDFSEGTAYTSNSPAYSEDGEVTPNVDVIIPANTEDISEGEGGGGGGGTGYAYSLGGGSSQGSGQGTGQGGGGGSVLNSDGSFSDGGGDGNGNGSGLAYAYTKAGGKASSSGSGNGAGYGGGVGANGPDKDDDVLNGLSQNSAAENDRNNFNPNAVASDSTATGTGTALATSSGDASASAIGTGTGTITGDGTILSSGRRQLEDQFNGFSFGDGGYQGGGGYQGDQAYSTNSLAPGGSSDSEAIVKATAGSDGIAVGLAFVAGPTSYERSLLPTSITSLDDEGLSLNSESENGSPGDSQNIRFIIDIVT
jgi:hypothetical protein